eukprot:19223-Heterococcus_DN1.PRE.2
MLMSSKTVAFCVGYGVTMAIALVLVRLRTGFEERKRQSSSDSKDKDDKPTFRKNLSYLRSQGSGGQLARSAPSSPRMTRPLSQGSQLGTLAGQPAAKQSRRLGHWTMNRKLVLVMVGLPARGKSYIVKMLIRYLSWIERNQSMSSSCASVVKSIRWSVYSSNAFAYTRWLDVSLLCCCYTTTAGFPTKVFNIGDYRRKLGFAGVDKSFFDADNAEGMRIREKMVEVVQDEMYTWLQQDEEAKVAVFDATNTTKARRKLLTERAREEKNALLVFIESICDDPEILAQNYKLKLQNDDYKHQDQQQALASAVIVSVVRAHHVVVLHDSTILVTAGVITAYASTCKVLVL